MAKAHGASQLCVGRAVSFGATRDHPLLKFRHIGTATQVAAYKKAKQAKARRAQRSSKLAGQA